MAAAGGVVVIGSRAEHAGGIGTSGATYVYEYDLGFGWVEVDKLMAGDALDQMGWSVAVGDWILAGAPFYDGDGVGGAAVMAFDRETGAHMFTEPPPTGAAGDFFGDRVAMHGTRG